VIKGDGLSVSIAAASIVAKVTRDRMMVEQHRRYPQYNFASHKGYSTPEHLHYLRMHGPCAIHRRTFAPVHDVTSDGSGDAQPQAFLTF
jgi:ribonuclease HII